VGLLNEQVPGEVEVDGAGRADQVFEDLLAVLPGRVDGQAVCVGGADEREEWPELGVFEPPVSVGTGGGVGGAGYVVPLMRSWPGAR
jgi:hypothetical protein